MHTKSTLPARTDRDTRMTKSGDDEVFDYTTGVVLPPVHPGHTLARELDARGLSANALALKLRVPANRLTEILRGQRAISVETALRLGRYYDTGAVFWMTLQGNYDLALAGQELGDRINQEIDAA
jgi:antitoxin HigA-1